MVEGREMLGKEGEGGRRQRKGREEWEESR
jgi:hypothetical protein